MVVLKRGDTRTAIKATLKTPAGAAADLTGATARFLLADLRGVLKIDKQIDVLDATEGKVMVVLEATEVDVAGSFRAEFEVTFDDGRVETYPNDGYISIKIIPDLG